MDTATIAAGNMIPSAEIPVDALERSDRRKLIRTKVVRKRVKMPVAGAPSTDHVHAGPHTAVQRS